MRGDLLDQELAEAARVTRKRADRTRDSLDIAIAHIVDAAYWIETRRYRGEERLSESMTLARLAHAFVSKFDGALLGTRPPPFAAKKTSPIAETVRTLVGAAEQAIAGLDQDGGERLAAAFMAMITNHTKLLAPGAAVDARKLQTMLERRTADPTPSRLVSWTLMAGGMNSKKAHQLLERL